MKREPKQKKFLRDSEVGIRRLPQIENLPVKDLTDQEICKLFFDRFGADALVMIYIPPDEGPQLFGRVRCTSKVYPLYRALLKHFDESYGYAINSFAIPEEEFKT